MMKRVMMKRVIKAKKVMTIKMIRMIKLISRSQLLKRAVAKMKTVIKKMMIRMPRSKLLMTMISVTLMKSYLMKTRRKLKVPR